MTRSPTQGLVRGDDVMWFDVEAGVGGVPTEVGPFLGWVDVTWLGPADPVRQLRDIIHVPRGLEAEMSAAVDRVQVLRQAALQSCRYCGERNIPGHMSAEDVCQSCAERHLGVAY